MAIDYAALKAELQNDPQAIGYAADLAARNDAALADMLNSLTIGQTKGFTLQRTTIDATTFQAAVVASEFTALTQPQRDLWQCILIASQQNAVNVKNANIRSQITAIWAAGTTTRANLVALQTRTCSRGEVLFGEGAQVLYSDVSTALNS